jgi:hypothetical protein
MSSTYSSSLRIELIGSGDQAGAWGTTTNGNLEYILDTAIAGYQAVTVTSTNQALTYVNGASSTASLNESIYAMLKFNSAAAASAIYAPPASKQYIIWNNSGYTITIYNSTVIGNTTAAGTGVAITNGNKVMSGQTVQIFMKLYQIRCLLQMGVQVRLQLTQHLTLWPQRRQPTDCLNQTAQTRRLPKLY